jgi:hypothetical protein
MMDGVVTRLGETRSKHRIVARQVKGDPVSKTRICMRG